MKIWGGLIAATLAGMAPSEVVQAAPGARLSSGAWEIGPTIRGRNYSRGMLHSQQYRDGWGFTIGPNAEPHYVTLPHGSLRGKRLIRMRFRVDGPRGAIIYGAKCPIGSPSAVTLYFQRRDDDWSSDGGRWWASFASVPLSGPVGEIELVAPLNARWTSVENMTAATNPAEFMAAKANAGRVGFTFANCNGYGHGARATMPVRFVVTRFEVL